MNLAQYENPYLYPSVLFGKLTNKEHRNALVFKFKFNQIFISTVTGYKKYLRIFIIFNNNINDIRHV